MIGQLAGTIDVAQVVLVVSCGLILGLFVWLHRENKREGYPLEDPVGRRRLFGWPLPPPPKSYKLLHGGSTVLPHPEGRNPVPMHHGPVPGAPFEPDGDPLLDGLGPASWAMKRDEPLLTWEGHPQLQPLRVLPGWTVDKGDPDPRGWPVFDGDGERVGTVADLWLDHAVKILRYLEVRLEIPGGAPRALVPIYFAEVSSRSLDIRVANLFVPQFATFPAVREPDTITAREEDQVSAYCAGGALFASRRRR